MIGPGTGARVYLAYGVTDMRKGVEPCLQIAHDASRFGNTLRSYSSPIVQPPVFLRLKGHLLNNQIRVQRTRRVN